MSICSLSVFVFTVVFTCSAVNSSDRLKQYNKKSSVLSAHLLFIGKIWKAKKKSKKYLIENAVTVILGSSSSVTVFGTIVLLLSDSTVCLTEKMLLF